MKIIMLEWEMAVVGGQGDGDMGANIPELLGLSPKECSPYCMASRLLPLWADAFGPIHMGVSFMGDPGIGEHLSWSSLSLIVFLAISGSFSLLNLSNAYVWPIAYFV